MKRNKIKPKYLNKIKPSISLSSAKQQNQNKIENSLLYSLISIGLILLLLLWSYILMFFLAIFGINYTNFSELGKIVYMLISDLALLLILIKIYQKEIHHDFHNYFNHNLLENLKQSMHYWAVGLFIMIISNYIIAILTNGKLATNEESVRSLIQLAPWYMAFELIIYAPISEELIFRKSIRKITNNRYFYVFLSGLIFGSLHVISSLNSPIDLLYLIPYCSLGFAFALLYSKTNNIFSTITIHSMHNTLALILYLISVKQ